MKRIVPKPAYFCLIFSLGLAQAHLPHVARAQVLDMAPEPKVSMLDDVSVDLRAGKVTRSMGQITIGPVGSPVFSFGILATSRLQAGTAIHGEVTHRCISYSGISCVYQYYYYDLGNEREIYQLSPPSTTAPAGFTEQGSLVGPGTTLTRKDGSVWRFSDQTRPINDGTVAMVTSVTYSDGEVHTYNYSGFELRSIVSNTGYMLHLQGNGVYGVTGYYQPTKVTLINLRTDYCAPLATSCTGLTVNWPSVSYSGWGTSTITATDNVGRSRTRSGIEPGRYRHTSPEGVWFEYKAQFFPGGSQPGATGQFCDPYTVLQWLETPAGRWNYTITHTSACHGKKVNTAVSTGPDGVTQRWEGGGFFDGLGRKTIYGFAEGANFAGEYDLGVMTAIELPERNRFDFSYDTRLNRTQTTATPRPSVGGTAISASASYPSSCTAATAKVCNKPTHTIDARGNQTDYTYSSEHGGVLTQTLPADVNGILRPQRRYTYEQRSARYKNSAGNLVSGSPIWKLVSVSSCQSTNSCAGTNDEVITSYTYDDNLLPITETVRTGTGTVLSSIARTYDPVGNVTSIDGPMPGTVDTTYFFYDDARQKIGEIGIDPDGAGPLPRPATRLTYNLDGQVKRTESGTATGTTLAALNSIVVAKYTQNDYDNLGRVARTTLVGGGVVHALSQYSYDVRDRTVCTAVRMNPVAYGSLPSTACALGPAGAYGPDRITKNTYNAAGELIQVTDGYGTASQRAYATYSYSDNGKLLNSIDANGNRTFMTYNGFDLLNARYYPSPTRPTAFDPSNPASALATAGAYSTSDYESFTYDNNGNRISWRRRDESAIGYSYDKLNRQIVRDIPGGTSKDVYTGYDLLNRVTYKRFAAHSGTGVSYVHDGLGRLLSATDMNGRTVGYQYNAASARTWLTYPDNSQIGYTLDNANRMTAFGWNATSGLFSQAYDSLGRLSSMTKGLGSTSFTYDAVGRLSSMRNDLSGSNYDITWTFSARNPAGQIITQSTSSDIYDYVETPYATKDNTYDGLNRDAAIAALSGGYDARGNMTRDGIRTFTYDLENRLLTAAGGSANLTLTYDPEGRIASYTSGATTTTFLYDGVDLIAEYGSGGNLLRRYVHGSGVDDPVVWLEGQSSGDTRYFYTNQQRSVVAYASSTGNLLELYKYGPFGEPMNASNDESWTGSRFRYTGQLIIPEAKLYHYKARVYDPIAGRFLQTDPIGDGDDLNLYAYVRNDPLNKRDPTGTTCTVSNGVYDCKVDTYVNWRGKEIARADFTKGQQRRVAAFEKRYTAAVNKLMSNSEKSRTLSFGGKSVATTAGEVGKALIDRRMEVNGRLLGGERVTGMGTRGNTTFVGPRGLSGEGEIAGVKTSDSGVLQEIAVVHEGMHGEGTNVSSTLRGDMPIRQWNEEHQIPFNEAAEDLLSR